MDGTRKRHFPEARITHCCNPSLDSILDLRHIDIFGFCNLLSILCKELNNIHRFLSPPPPLHVGPYQTSLNAEKQWPNHSQLEHTHFDNFIFLPSTGFLLLEAGDEDLPEHIQTASLPGRNLSSTEPTDLAYFSSLRDLDLMDNRLPNMACLCTLTNLTRLILCANRMTNVGLTGLMCQEIPVGHAPVAEVEKKNSGREIHPRPAVLDSGGGSSIGSRSGGAVGGVVGMEIGMDMPFELPLQLLETLDLSFNMLAAEEVMGVGSVLSSLPR